MKHSNPVKFLEQEVHGNRVVHFDKLGVTDVAPLDAVEFSDQIGRRWEILRVNFPLFQSLTLKEINRGNAIEAHAFYQGFTLRPLLEALRMELTPYHYNFHTPMYTTGCRLKLSSGWRTCSLSPRWTTRPRSAARPKNGLARLPPGWMRSSNPAAQPQGDEWI